MSEVSGLGARRRAPGGYHLGDPIALEDFLALPPDGRRYRRDARGRLALMSPEDTEHHGTPIARLTEWLHHALARPWFIVVARSGIAFRSIRALDGRLLPRSRLGPKTLEPDLAVFARQPGHVRDRRGRARGYDPEPLRLVIEVLSPGTHRQDLGLGRADAVDRPRSYKESGVPEYWLINAADEDEHLALPPRTGLFLSAGRGAWEALPVEGLVRAPGRIHGLAPVAAGRVPSIAVPGLVLDLGAFWGDLDDPV